MKLPRVLDRVSGWLLQSRRRQLLAASVSLGAAAVVVGASAYLAIFAAGGAGPAAPAPVVQACDEPTLIDPVAAPPSGGWQKVTPPAINGCFSLTATAADAAGVTPDSGFVLRGNEPIDIAALAGRIQVEPTLEFRLQAEGPREVRLQPDQPLAEGQVYRFTILDRPGGLPIRSWAFQAQRPLRIVQTLPADQSSDVPLNIGVELTFSHDGVTGVEENFKIEPPVRGRFEVHKRVAVFVPEGLEPETLYTVTLGTGVGMANSTQTLGQEFIFRFETGTTTRTGEVSGQPVLQFSRRVWESPTGEAPVLALFTTQGDPGSRPNLTLPFAVYRFRDISGFLNSLDQVTAIPAWARFTRGRFAVDTAGLKRVASFEASLEPIGQFGDLFVRFPEPLAAGYYLVEARFQEQPLQAWLQVTDIATYVSVSRNRTLVWANDAATKSPAAGATVRLAGSDFSVSTGADGIAFFDTPQDLIRLQPSPYGYTTTETVGNFIVTAPDGRAAVVPLADIFSGFKYFGFREYGFSGDPSLYWRFLFTDRHLYRPADTVHFWGLVRPRENPPPAQQVVVEISGSSYLSFDYRPVVLARTELSTTPMGTFIGELNIKGASPGFYNLQARVGNQVIASTYLEVQDFVKPAYKIDVTPSRKASFAGETTAFTINAAFFDGSPLPGAQLSYNTKEGSATLTTDPAGRALVSFSGQVSEQFYGSFDWFYLNVVPALAEEGEITGSGWVQVFPSALTIDTSSEFSAGTATVSGNVYNLDLDRINGDQAKDLFDFRGDPAPGRQVVAQVVEQSFNRIEIGETYDFIAKIVRKEYRYEPVRAPIGQFGATSDSQGRFAISFAAVKDKSYEVTLRVTDNAGRTFSTQTYVYGGAFFSPGNLPYLAPESQGPYAIGDEVAVTMRQGDQDLPAGDDNRYLFYLAQNGVRDYATQDSPRYSFPFAEAHVPNINVMGVRFTGRTYQEVNSPHSAVLDSSLRKLAIAVQPDKDRYRPGEEATLNISVTDPAGRPVQAEVNLSAVDEAIFRLQGQSFFYDLGILGSLYQTVSSGILRTYASHQYPEANPAAEKGGGDGARDNFKDVALFDRVTTDAQGQASISFTLPDNLTSWRVTALAVTQDLYAGSSVALVPAGLPLFVDVAMNTHYLTTDEPSIKVRAFGEALAAGDQVAFEVASPTLLDQPLTAGGPAFTAVDIPLLLRDGQHKLTIRASARGLEDALVRTITVTPSRLLRSESRFHELRPGQSLTPEGSSDRLTHVILSDHNRGRYYPALLSLSWTYGDRLDQMLARNLSQELLAQYFQEGTAFPAEFRSSLYQTPDGGIALFPFADDDLTLSARVAGLAPDRFGRQALAQFFLRIADSADETRERNVIALYGLAALDEPVLPNVQALVTLGDLTVRERLYLALAAAALGDQDTAFGLYRGLLADFGERRGGSVRLKVGADQDDILEATSLAAILAAALSDDLAPLLFDYSTSNYTKDTLIQLEQISYLVESLPNLAAAPVRFAYTQNGQRNEALVQREETLTLIVTPQELADLELEVLDGTLGVATSFLAPLDPASVEVDPAVSVSRTYPGQEVDKVTVAEGDLVRISISFDLQPQALDGCYQVSDLLPSGLKPITRLYAWGITDPAAAYPYAVEGQRVSFCVYKDSLRRPLVYYARVIGKGTYAAEPAVIQSQKAPESINLTPSLQVEIR